MPPQPAPTLSFVPAAALPRPPRRASLRARAPPRSASTSAAPATRPPSPGRGWRRLTAADGCLRLRQTLHNGQAFRWHLHGDAPFAPARGGHATEFSGAVGRHLFHLRQAAAAPPAGAPDPVWFRELTGARGAEAALRDYLRAGVDQTAVLARCAEDARFAKVLPHLKGVRVLRTPPGECVFSFICSANNNLPRIAKMVRFLARRYGSPLGTCGGEAHFRFPTAEEIAAGASEAELREAGFGYRARYIVETARRLRKLGVEEGVAAEQVLEGWRGLERGDVVRRLMQFPGVGRKVAGCIALFSLDQLGEVPCDTHIMQIAARYVPELKQKSLTERVHEQVGDLFRGKFGEDTAGIAQTILFTAELGEFRELVPGAEKRGKVVRRRKKKAGNAASESTEVRAGKEEETVRQGKEEAGVALKKEEEVAVKAEQDGEDFVDIPVTLEAGARKRGAKRENSPVRTAKEEDVPVTLGHADDALAGEATRASGPRSTPLKRERRFVDFAGAKRKKPGTASARKPGRAAPS